MQTRANKQEPEQEIKIPRFYKTREVAKLWGLTHWSVRNLVLTGKVKPIVGLSKGWLFLGNEINPDDLERL